MHDDGLAVQAESQQRPAGQVLQRPIHQDRSHTLPAAGQNARLPGRMQQRPPDPCSGQHRHDLHHLGGYA